MRYLAESSFWVYIIHVPIIALMQALLLPLAWPVAVKFLLVAAVAIALSLLSYEYIVRRSLVGEIINGARKRTVKRGRFGPEFGWIATLAVVVLVFAGGGLVFPRLLLGQQPPRGDPRPALSQCPALDRRTSTT